MTLKNVVSVVKIRGVDTKLLAAFAIMLAVPIWSEAKCPIATLHISGTIESESLENPQLSVRVKTPRGDSSERAEVSNHQFAVNVQFSTHKSYFFLWGHRCTNEPTDISITLSEQGRMLVERTLEWEDFVLREPDVYVLRKPLTLTLSSPKPK